MKVIKIILGLLVIAIVILIAILSNLNTIIRETVETVGPEVTKTAVRLNEVDIDLIKGRIALSGFHIANPEGFDIDNPLLTMQAIVLHIDTRSLVNRVKVIKEITVDGIKVTAEHKNIQDTNIQVMVDNIKRSSTTAALTEEPQSPDQKATGEKIRFMIEELNFSNSSIELITEKWGKHHFELPSFSKTAIGDNVEGLTKKQVINVILATYMVEIKNLLQDEVKQLARSNLKNKVKDTIKKYKKSLLEKLGIDGS